MLLLLTYFHMYWMLIVLQDIYQIHGKMIKRRNTGKCKAEKRKGAKQKPTHTLNLGRAPTWKQPRPNRKPTRARRWRAKQPAPSSTRVQFALVVAWRHAEAVHVSFLIYLHQTDLHVTIRRGVELSFKTHKI